MDNLGAHVIDMYRQKLSDLHRRSREAIEQMSDEDVNWRPNAESNSVANLIVHLAGNLHQRLASGIGGAPDRRDRDAEFSSSVHHTGEHLREILEEAFREADAILGGITPEQLSQPQQVRNRQITVLDVLFRVSTHASEHVGQILYIAKLRRGSAYRILSIPRKMETVWHSTIWSQFGAAIDMLENAMRACPDQLWSDRSQRPEFWYLVYHTLFWLDHYLSDSFEDFVPPAPFNLDEMDPAGLLPEHPYSKDQMQAYLEHGRKKCQATIEGLTEEKVGRRCRFPWGELNFGELLLYNMRHVQHHAAQLNLILRQQVDSAPGWVATVKSVRTQE